MHDENLSQRALASFHPIHDLRAAQHWSQRVAMMELSLLSVNIHRCAFAMRVDHTRIVSSRKMTAMPCGVAADSPTNFSPSTQKENCSCFNKNYRLTPDGNFSRSIKSKLIEKFPLRYIREGRAKIRSYIDDTLKDRTFKQSLFRLNS